MADDKKLVEERKMFTRKGEKVSGFASSVVPTLEEKVILERLPPTIHENGEAIMDSPMDNGKDRSRLGKAEDPSTGDAEANDEHRDREASNEAPHGSKSTGNHRGILQAGGEEEEEEAPHGSKSTGEEEQTPHGSKSTGKHMGVLEDGDAPHDDNDDEPKTGATPSVGGSVKAGGSGAVSLKSDYNAAGGSDSREEQQDSEPPEARVHDKSKELFGAPADASTNRATDDEVPHARAGKIDSTKEEDAAVHARKVIRKHLAAKVGTSQWAVPTDAPEVDPHGFEDPISDAFWKNVWVASAVHNVSA